MRLLAFTLVSLACTAPTFAQKPKAVVQPAEVRAVLDELAVVRAPKDVLDLPKDYAADSVSVADVLKDPKKYPLRAAVLHAAEALKPARAFKPVEEFKADRPKAKEAFKVKQIPLAVMIDDLGDAIAELQKHEPERAKESKRWKANYDVILAEALYRQVVLHEIDKAYGQVLTEQLPEPGDAKLAVWKLVPAEKLISNRDIRDQLTVARGKLTAIVREFKGRDGTTPWYFLADELADKPAGLKWELVEPK